MAQRIFYVQGTQEQYIYDDSVPHGHVNIIKTDNGVIVAKQCPVCVDWQQAGALYCNQCGHALSSLPASEQAVATSSTGATTIQLYRPER